MDFSLRLLVVTLCSLSALLPVRSQFGDLCPEIDASGVASVIMDSYGGGDNPDPPTITDVTFNIVCRSAGPIRSMYRILSLVAMYNCIGSPCEDSTVTAQFDTECVDGVWEEMVISVANDEIRTEPANGNFQTDTRTDCLFCLSPLRADSFGLASDLETHCVGKYSLSK